MFPMPCSITIVHIPTGLWQQEYTTMTKHAHRAMNLANEDVDLVGIFDNMCWILVEIYMFVDKDQHARRSELFIGAC